MKYILLILTLFIMSCKAQTVSLETIAKCMVQNPSQPCPNFTYAKDINNSLNKYIGAWKGSRDGKNYEFNFIKKEFVGEDIKDDRLIGRLKITNSVGNIIYNTLNEPDDAKTRFHGDNFQKDLKVYLMRFSGDKLGCIDYGYIYIWIKPETPNQMGINFHPDNDIVTQDCNNFQTTLPNNQIIHLTRQ